MRLLAPALFGVPGGAVLRGRRRVHRDRRDHDRWRGHGHSSGVHGTPAAQEPEPTEEQYHLAPHTLSFAHGRRDALAGRPVGRGRGWPPRLPPEVLPLPCLSAGQATRITGGATPRLRSVNAGVPRHRWLAL